MDDLLNIFVSSNYTQETQEDIFQSLGLFRVFNYLDPFAVIDNILMSESYMESTQMADGVMNVIMAAQEYIMDRHGVKTSEESTLAFNNIVLKNLFQLQKLEDPVPVLRELESDADHHEKFCAIMAMFSDTPMEVFMQIIEEVRPVCITMLSEYLYAQEEGNQKAVEQIPKNKKYIKMFKDTYGIPEPVQAILYSDTIMGESFSVYLPLFQELRELVSDESDLVKTLLFLLLFSSDGVNEPLLVYRQYSETLVPDLATANRLERTLAELYNQMTRNQQKETHEKT